MLFSDLAGSTALGEQLDPEDVRRVQAELFELLNAEVVRFGGTTEKFVGDAVLAVFGIPSAHEDDPERAVRAALAAHERFDGFAERIQSRFGLRVGLRTGINTGDVVSGRETAARGELMVSGDAVNVAARLQQAAQPGEILVGARTHGATSRAVVYGPRSEVDAKGKSAPVSAWRACSVAAEPAVRGSEVSAPLVGREEELTLLEMVAARGQRERVPQLVTLFGPAGVGKSRLVGELLARVPAVRVLRGRCLPYGEGITYWPLAEAAKGDADILDTDPAEVAHEKLRTAVHEVVEQGGEEVFDAIAWTIGLTGDDSPFSSMDTPSVGSALADGWQRYIGALSRRGLTVLVIEDIHWASAALLDLVEYLVDRISDARVVLVCTARPEFLADHPSWGAGKQNATALSLTPLTAEESERLVSSLLGEARVPEEVRRPLLSSAEGNPFFLEEMLQMLIDEGAVQREKGGWAATRRLAELRIPDSVHGVIAARLDLLGLDAREALRRCAVVGRVFWPSAVGVDEELVTGLTGTGLVSPQAVSVMGGLREFTFKHALTRDVAYASLPRHERRALHRRVAEWIQSVAPDRDVETAELVGYHYREAIAYGEDDPKVARRAYSVLLAAGEAANRRAALAAANDHFVHALALASDDLEGARVLLGLIEVETTAARWSEALERLDEADRLANIDARTRSEILGWRSRVSWLTGRWAEALESAEEAVAALSGLPESVQLARAVARRSQIEMLRNRPTALDRSREAVEIAERVGDEYSVINSRINLMTVEASQYGQGPDPDEVTSISQRAAAIGAHEEATRVLVNFTWSATGYFPVGQIESVVRTAMEKVFVPESIADYLDLSIGWMLHLPAGRWDELEDPLERLGRKPPGGATTLLLLRPLNGSLAWRRGELGKAETWLAGLHDVSLESGEAQRVVPSATAVLPWLHLTGRRDELRRVATEVVEAVGREWPVVISVDPVLRSMAASGELDLLEQTLASLRDARGGSVARLALSIGVGDALLDIAGGRFETAAERLTEAVTRNEELGFLFDAACLKLDLAEALDHVGAANDAARARAKARQFLEALRCVNPF